MNSRCFVAEVGELIASPSTSSAEVQTPRKESGDGRPGEQVATTSPAKTLKGGKEAAAVILAVALDAIHKSVVMMSPKRSTITDNTNVMRSSRK